MSSIRQLVDPKIVRIVDLFLKNSEKIHHLHKISIDAKVPIGTTHRLVKKLVRAEFLKITTVGKIKLYSLNPEKKKEYEALAK